MNFNIDPTDADFRARLGDFFRTEVADELLADVHASAGFTPSIWSLLRKLGSKHWLAPAFPVEFGGLGSYWLEAVLADELNYWLGTIQFGTTGTHIAGPLIEAYGTEQQKNEYLPHLAAGEIEIAVGFTEPEAGSDLAAIKIKARKDGGHYRIDGQKMFNTGCHYAQYVLLAARTDAASSRHTGISLLIVPMDTKGIQVRPVWTVDGERTNEVFYDNVMVPASNMVGEEGRGFHYIVEGLTRHRLYPVGGIRRVLEEFVAYLRKQDAGDVALWRSVAELATRLEAAQLLAYQTAWASEHGVVPTWQGPAGKVIATELIREMAQVMLDFLGSSALIKAGSANALANGMFERFIRAALARTIRGGTAEIQRNAVVFQRLHMPRR